MYRFMLKGLIHYRSRSISSAALVVAGFTVFGNILSLIRNSLLASQFGAGRELDIYYAAFRIPDFIYSIFYLGVISIIFLPVFNDLFEREPGSAWRFFGASVRIIAVVCAAGATILFVVAPALLEKLVPGFAPKELSTLIWMTRLMLIQPIILGVSNLISSVLQSFERFASASLAYVAYNCGIIVGIFLFVPRFGVAGLAWGVVLGAVLHLMIQLPAFLSVYERNRISFGNDLATLKPYLHLIPPRIIGIASAQVNIFIITALASAAAGSVAVFSLANDIQNVPQTVIAVSLAIAVFPALSRKAFTDHAGFAQLLTNTVRKTAILLIPVSLCIMTFRAQIVRLILGYGAFGWEHTILTLQTLFIFGVGIAIQGLLPVLMRAFFAIQNTRIPLAAALVSNAATIAAGPYLVSRYGAPGLAGAFVLANIASVLLLLVVLERRSLISLRALLKQCGIVIGISICASAVGWLSLRVWNNIFDTHTVVGLAVQTGLSLLGFAAAFLALARILKIRDYEEFVRFFIQSRSRPGVE